MTNNNVPEKKLLEVLKKQQEILNKFIAATKAAAKCKQNINALIEARADVAAAYVEYNQPRQVMVEEYCAMNDHLEVVRESFNEYVYADCKAVTTPKKRS